MEDYRLLKNRKTARLQRLKRKSDDMVLTDKMDNLGKENYDLRARIRELEFELYGKLSSPINPIKVSFTTVKVHRRPSDLD